LEAAPRGAHHSLTLAATLCLMLPVSAWGGALCPGKYHATAVGHWQRDTGLSVPLETNGAAGKTRASVFRAGLQQSGIRIDDKSPIRLQVVLSVASSGNEAHVYPGLDWTYVDTALSTNLKDPALSGSSLSITAVVSDDNKHHTIWAATMQCVIATDDSAALASEIGVELGRALSASLHSSH
jgi:hypothetical protein